MVSEGIEPSDVAFTSELMTVVLLISETFEEEFSFLSSEEVVSLVKVSLTLLITDCFISESSAVTWSACTTLLTVNKSKVAEVAKKIFFIVLELFLLLRNIINSFCQISKFILAYFLLTEENVTNKI